MLHQLDPAARHEFWAGHSEHDVQAALEKTPHLLVNRADDDILVIPQQRLGSEYVTDFLISDNHSWGREWEAVELESPKAKMFTKSGDPTKQLTHAIRQIQDWRAWLSRNQNYAARSTAEGGLGLKDIYSRIPGSIYIGRRDETDPSTNERRRQMVHDLKIEIHSYDHLLYQAKYTLCWLDHDSSSGELFKPPPE